MLKDFDCDDDDDCRLRLEDGDFEDFDDFFLPPFLLELDADLSLLETAERDGVGISGSEIASDKSDSSSPKATLGIPFVDLALLRRVGVDMNDANVSDKVWIVVYLYRCKVVSFASI